MVTEEPTDPMVTEQDQAPSRDGDQMTTLSLDPRPTQPDHPAVRHPDVRPSDTFSSETAALPPVLRVEDLSFYYGTFRAVKDITFDIPTNRITALIGPSGCGKSTLLRTLNRMNDLIPGTKVTGRVEYQGQNLYGPSVDPVEVRRRIGMVFQKANPFPKSIFDNVAFGPRLTGYKGDMGELVERSLRRAAIWDEVKDDYRKKSALALSGGQQQRLCIARTLATDPEVILMDEPCSALDPVATLQIEQLMSELRENYTIVIVTHNMQQASRVSDETAFFSLGQDRAGFLVEMDRTTTIFTNPRERLTEDYVSGRFG